jgi:Fic family protein
MGSNDLLSARYVAPPESEIDGLMDRLEKYINAPKVIPTLVDIAIIHYQFEAIHPFGDGNGRLGRLLISMLLATREMLSEPVLYLSAYFERHKMDYVTRMWRISSAGEWADWIKFFLAGVKSEAQDLSAKAKRLLVLREDLRKELQKKQSAAKQLQLLDSLFRWPIITVNRAAQLLGMTHQGATKHIQSFQKKGILKEATGNDRNRMYIAVPIVELLS